MRAPGPSGPPAGPGIPSVVARPTVDLAPLLTWLRTGRAAEERLDFPAGTILPDGRLDLCKQQLGPYGAVLVAEALRPRAAAARPGPVRHLLLGTDGLGDDGAAAAVERAVGSDVETLYLAAENGTAFDYTTELTLWAIP